MGLNLRYKQTEVGVIPGDWDLVSLESVARVTSGKRLPAGYSLTDSETPHPYIRVSDMFQGGIVTNSLKYVPVAAFPPISRYRIFKEDLFISVAGTLGLVGSIPDELDGANLTENADRITNISCDRDYLLYVLLSPLIQSVIESIRTVGAQPKLALTRIRKFSIPLPPTVNERRAISTTLSDVDTLVEGLDRLIDKKRYLKQAAMQQLLTGQTRLPGFEGEWRPVKFGELALPSNSRVDPSRSGPHGFCVELENIEQGTGRLLGCSSTTPQSSLKATFGPGDVLFGKLRAYLRKYWLAKRTGVCSTEIWVLKPDPESVTSGYLYQLVTTNWFIEAASTAYGTHMPRSDWKVVRELALLIPSIPEQEAIAIALGDMDAEIEALEQRRAKTADLKQAMMQELLTGRTRLITPEKRSRGVAHA